MPYLLIETKIASTVLYIGGMESGWKHPMWILLLAIRFHHYLLRNHPSIQNQQRTRLISSRPKRVSQPAIPFRKALVHYQVDCPVSQAYHPSHFKASFPCLERVFVFLSGSRFLCLGLALLSLILPFLNLDLLSPLLALWHCSISSYWTIPLIMISGFACLFIILYYMFEGKEIKELDMDTISHLLSLIIYLVSFWLFESH